MRGKGSSEEEKMIIIISQWWEGSGKNNCLVSGGFAGWGHDNERQKSKWTAITDRKGRVLWLHKNQADFPFSSYEVYSWMDPFSETSGGWIRQDLWKGAYFIHQLIAPKGG